MLPKNDASHDKTCQGSSSLERMTDVTPAPAVSGLSLAVMLDIVFTEGCLGRPRTPLGSPCDPISRAPGVRGICWSAHSRFQHLLELAKLYCEPWRISGLMSLSKVALQRTSPIPVQETTQTLKQPQPRRLTRDTQTRPPRSSGHDRLIFLHVFSPQRNPISAARLSSKC